MHRHHIPTEALLAGDATLDGEDARHLQSVLRVRTGECVEVFDGRGHTRAMSVAEVGKRHVRLVANGDALPHAPPDCRVTLFSAAFKPARMDWLVEKAVELGAWQVTAFAAERSVVKIKSDSVARWRRIAREALRQCGGAWEPEIEAVDFKAFCGRVADMTQRGGAVWFGDLGEGAVSFRDELGRARSPQGACAPPRRHELPNTQSWLEPAGGAERSPRPTFGWCVGPEGDFTPAEMEAMREAGAKGVSLGPRVLRSETAGVFGLCAIGLLFDGNRQHSTAIDSNRKENENA